MAHLRALALKAWVLQAALRRAWKRTGRRPSWGAVGVWTGTLALLTYLWDRWALPRLDRRRVVLGETGLLLLALWGLRRAFPRLWPGPLAALAAAAAVLAEELVAHEYRQALRRQERRRGPGT